MNNLRSLVIVAGKDQTLRPGRKVRMTATRLYGLLQPDHDVPIYHRSLAPIYTFRTLKTITIEMHGVTALKHITLFFLKHGSGSILRP